MPELLKLYRAYMRVVWSFWLRKLGRKWFWGLFAGSALLAIFLQLSGH